MNKKSILSVMLVSLLALSLMFVGCSNPSGGGGSEGGGGGSDELPPGYDSEIITTSIWNGIYSFSEGNDNGAYVKLVSGTTLTVKIEGDPVTDTITLKKGGKVIQGGSEIGEYVFIYTNTLGLGKIGIFWSETGGKHVSIFKIGVQNHISEAASQGATFSPTIDTTSINNYGGEYISGDLGSWPY
jgi:hypothetical protein